MSAARSRSGGANTGKPWDRKPQAAPRRHGPVQPHKAAQRLVEGRDIAELGMIGEQRNHIALVAEHILGKSLQCLLRPHFHEDARAGV